MITFFRLIRWPNIIIIPLVMAVIKFAVMDPMLAFTGIEASMPLTHFWLMVAATVFLGGGGYIINDYFDCKIDLINKPSKVVVGQNISRISAISLHVFFNAAALLIGFWLAWQVHLWWVAAIYMMVSGLFWFYSTTYKRMFLIGNIIVSALTALVPLQVLLFEYTYMNNNLDAEILTVLKPNLNTIAMWVFAFSFFAFMSNLIREIVKDFEDIRGDMRYGRKSVPIVMGLRKSKWAVQILTAITITAIFFVAGRVVNDYISWIYIPLFVVGPLILHMVWLHQAERKQHFHRLSQLMKLIMLTGLMYGLIVYYNVMQLP